MLEITEKRKLGNLGEDLACRFLIKQGFDIVERNYWKKWGEIDIIAKNGLGIHFIEVKSVSCLPDRIIRAGENINQVSRENNDNYRPEDNIHPWKLQRLARTIQTYLLEKNISHETNWQFDVITVYIDKKRLISKVSMLENVIL